MSTNLLLSGHQAEVLTLGFNANSSLLASAGQDRNVLLWSPQENWDNLAVLKGHGNAITSLCWTHTDRLITASADKTLCSWDLEVAQPIYR